MSSEDPFGGLFGDPEELRRRMEQFAEQMQGAQRVQWADNAIKLAVDMTVAGLARMNLQGNAEQQSQDLLQAMRLMFPEAVILVRERARASAPRAGDPAPPGRARPSRSSRPSAMTSLKLRTRNTNTSAAKPIPKVSTPIAICWPTEYAATMEPAAVPANTFASRACCTPAPCGVNGTAADTAFTPSTSSTFFTDPPTLKASSSIQNATKRQHHPANWTANTSRQ